MRQIDVSKTRNLASLGIVALIVGVAVWAIYSIALADKPAWGTFMHGFVFFTALTQGTFAIAIGVRLASGRWAAPYIRLASAINMAFMPFAIIMLIIVFMSHGSIHFWAAEPDKHLWFNPIFFIFRNVLFFSLFYGLSYKLYKLVRKNGADVDDGLQHKIVMSGFWLVLTYVLGMTSFSWDMSMTLNHGYADTIYGFQFIVSTVHGGMALMVVLSYFTDRYLKLKAFPLRTYAFGAQLQLALCIIFFYAWWAQFFPTWYSHLPEETHSLFARAEGEYFPIYLATLALAGIIPFISLLFTRVRSSKPALTIISSIILTGLWFERYLQTNPALAKYMSEKVTVIHLFNPVNILFTVALLGGLMFSFMRVVDKSPETIPYAPDEPEYENDGVISKVRGW